MLYLSTFEQCITSDNDLLAAAIYAHGLELLVASINAHGWHSIRIIRLVLLNDGARELDVSGSPSIP